MIRRRPDLNAAVYALIRDIARRMPEFSHIRATRILVVAGEARRASRGTVKPLAFSGGRSTDRLTGRKKPIVKVGTKRMLYSITLRPLFFRDSTPQDRIETVIHELFHISMDFDGTLDRTRRHARMGPEFGKELRPLVRRYLQECPEALREAFSHDGEVLIQQWLERPTATFLPEISRTHRVYTEKHLFLGPVEMLTPKPWRKRVRKRVRKRKTKEPVPANP